MRLDVTEPSLFSSLEGAGRLAPMWPEEIIPSFPLRRLLLFFTTVAAFIIACGPIPSGGRGGVLQSLRPRRQPTRPEAAAKKLGSTSSHRHFPAREKRARVSGRWRQ